MSDPHQVRNKSTTNRSTTEFGGYCVLCESIQLGCSRGDALECLRQKTPAEVTAKQWEVKPATSAAYFFVPTVDEKFLTKSPVELVKAGEFQRKNVLLGMNNNEGNLYTGYRSLSRIKYKQHATINASDVDCAEHCVRL